MKSRWLYRGQIPLETQMTLSNVEKGDLISFFPDVDVGHLVLEVSRTHAKVLNLETYATHKHPISFAAPWIKLISRCREYQSTLFSPLKTEFQEPPLSGRFGAIREHDIHTGVDLFAPEGTIVHAIEPGMVVAVVPFTGIAAESPWWLDTQAVMVEGASGVILYGEVTPFREVGDFVFGGTTIGTVKRVLKKDKGKPVSMLHLECYVPGTTEPVWWKLNEPQPKELLDPTFLVEKHYAVQE